MLSFFKALFIRILERTRLIARSRAQVFLFEATSIVTNTTDKSIVFFVVIPIPQETRYQKLLGPIEWSDTSVVMQRDQTYGNRFGVWQGTLAPQQERECRMSCRVAVSPARVSISRNATFEQYKNVSPDLIETYTAHNRFVDGSEPRVQKIADTLTSTTVSVRRYFKRAYDHVVSKLTYGNPIRGLYSFRDAFTRGVVDCGGFSTFMISLLHARRIPARLAVGFFANKTSHDSMHAWLEALLPNGEWVPFDPSQDHLLWRGRDRTKSGGFGFIGSDHILTSVGCDISINLQGRVCHVDLLQHPMLVEGEGQGVDFKSHVSITQ